MPQANPESLHGKCALITGASRRIGAAIAELLHHHGANVAIHYRGSEAHAAKLSARLNQHRTGSARIFKSDLAADGEPASLIDAVLDWSGQLDILINNASSFYATPLGTITEDQWTELVGSNLKAPLFLSQAAIPHLKASRGVIVNITDIHANRPLRDHTVYCVAKAGLAMLTRSLARDLAPEIRVNGVAPGAIAWPENDMTDAIKEHILGQIPLGRSGNPADIAGCVLFLVRDATYSTGQIITIDGGRSLGWG
ncbi:MAG: pteridine reductase [Gammaproteobacteria bacterium]|nr:MAG: pteridine reductase [Gammaproteobacteria bacterium]